MRLELDNVVVETEDPIKINRYIELGYKKIGTDKEVVEDGETRTYHDLNKDELITELDKAGKEYNKRATKDELIAILESDE